MLWVRASVAVFRYTDYNTDSMKQIKERIRFIKLSLVGYGNPQNENIGCKLQKDCEVKVELHLNNCVVCLRLFQACND